MRLLHFLVCAAALASSVVMTASAGKIQSPNAKANTDRANAIRSAFQSSFNDYLEYAEGADELLPLTKRRQGGFGNWGATFVDALDTAHIMGLDDIVERGIAFVGKIDFTKTSQKEISIFETNIRYIAGLLSLYEMRGQKDQVLVKQSQVIGDRLMKGFVGNNAIPYNELLDWSQGGRPNTTRPVIIAEAGTLLIEMDRLSKYTNEPKYVQAAARSMKAVINSNAVFPGLYAQEIDAVTAEPKDDYVTWGGGSDSFFEYLVKYGQLIGSCDTYIATWIDSIKSSIKYILTRPAETKAKVTFLSDYSKSNGGLIPQFSHLGCFAPGNWILGGKLLDNDDIFQYGLALADGCGQTYSNSITGIGPEIFVFKSTFGSTNQVEINDPEFYARNGWDYSAVDYVLRPEVIESLFYAFRTTGDSMWQDRAWNAWQAISKYCKAPAAYAGIAAVNSTSTKQLNDSESFLYAELFKYLFLIFSDPNLISLDEYVFNTEAHPFKIEKQLEDSKSCSVGDLPQPSYETHEEPPTPATGTKGPLPSSDGALKPITSGLAGLSGILSQLGDTVGEDVLGPFYSATAGLFNLGNR